MKPIRRLVGRTAIVIRRLRDAHNPARREQRNAMHKRFLGAARAVHDIHAQILPLDRHLTNNPTVATVRELIRSRIKERDRLSRQHRLFRSELFPVLSAPEKEKVRAAIQELRILEAALEQKTRMVWREQAWLKKEFQGKKKKPIGVQNLEKQMGESLDFLNRESGRSMKLRAWFNEVLSTRD